MTVPVSELAATLGIDRLAVLGVSGGDPGTLAYAWRIPERLSAVGVKRRSFLSRRRSRRGFTLFLALCCGRILVWKEDKAG